MLLIGTVAPLSGQHIGTRLDSLFRDLGSRDAFSGAVLVLQGDSVILRRALGFASEELRVLNTPETVFHIGSITKGFTAALVMRLAEQGRLSPDDRLRAHMPELPSSYDEVTVHQALTHTAGIPDPNDHPSYTEVRAVPIELDSLVAEVTAAPPVFPPGSQFRYSNGGYILLGALIERLSGMSYDRFLAEQITEPLGLSNTGVARSSRVIPGEGAGYELTDRGLRPAPPLDLSRLHAAGALYSTIDDLATWIRAFEAGQVLNEESIRRALTPHGPGFGYGWEVIPDLEGAPALLHNGAIEGFLSNVTHFPTLDVTIVIFSNVVAIGSDVRRPRLASIRRTMYEIIVEETIRLH